MKRKSEELLPMPRVGAKKMNSNGRTQPKTIQIQ